MTRRTAILQTSANANTATEALDMALALASMDQPVQLVLSGEAVKVLQQNPSKRYAMLELLDAEPIGLVSDNNFNIDPDLALELDTQTIATAKLRELLDSFDEVLQFS
jgi:tRNA 2-thiouridine synthesizing protein C